MNSGSGRKDHPDFKNPFRLLFNVSMFYKMLRNRKNKKNDSVENLRRNVLDGATGARRLIGARPVEHGRGSYSGG